MPDRPNILFIITDHTSALSIAEPQCLTPNLDALTAAGIRFGRYYTTNAICSPARASLISFLDSEVGRILVTLADTGLDRDTLVVFTADHGDMNVFSPGGIDELYELADDPQERRNLVDDPAHREILHDMVKRMWRRMKAIGDESLFNTHYATLRTAPIGPLSIESS